MIAWLLWAALGPAWQVERCPELDIERLVELTSLDTGEHPEGTQFVVRCEDESFVLGVHRRGRPSIERVIPRREVTAGSPERYLATELAELYVGSGYQVAESSQPQTDPPPDSNPEPPAPDSAPARDRWGLLAAAGRFEIGGDPVLPAGGAAVSIYARVWDHLNVRAELSGLGGAREVDRGRVHGASVWGTAALLGTVDGNRATLHAGAGARIGGAWFRGAPTSSSLSGRTHGGLSWSPLVSAAVVAPRHTRFAFLAAIDAGWVLRPIRGFSEGEVVVSSGGPWVGLSLGLGARFGS